MGRLTDRTVKTVGAGRHGDGDGLQLNDILREYVILSLPMHLVCSEACLGICPVCGQNRNLRACGCEIKPVDDRWAALKRLQG